MPQLLGPFASCQHIILSIRLFLSSMLPGDLILDTGELAPRAFGS